MTHKRFPITLTYDERKAIDFVVDKYCTGEIKFLLMSCTPMGWHNEDGEPPEMTYNVPQWAVWCIYGLRKLEQGYPCWAGTLCDKFDTLIEAGTKNNPREEDEYSE